MSVAFWSLLFGVLLITMVLVGSLLARLAASMLGVLHYLVPTNQKPVRADGVARVAAGASGWIAIDRDGSAWQAGRAATWFW